MPYSLRLQRLAMHGSRDMTPPQWSTVCNSALDGEPARALRQQVPLAVRRRAGVFFTGLRLATRLLKKAEFRARTPLVVLDPACGAGDLLLSAARRLPLGRNLEQTIAQWGQILHGRDLQPQFVVAARARLLILARHRHRAFASGDITWSSAFPNIRTGDALRDGTLYARADFTLLNPSFAPVLALDDCSWAAGKVNSAALFLERAATRVRDGSRILAILPEVLRTGSRYAKWRRLISDYAKIQAIEPAGLFDNSADVDVFILVLQKRVAKPSVISKAWLPDECRVGSKLQDHFTVAVGPVVPYREPRTGPSRRYIHPRNVRPWQEVRRVSETRRFSGTVFNPPFVAIRRTSRPGDKLRAVGTLILGAEPVAVENHLIVCTPKDGSVETCRHLLQVLKHPRTTTFLNLRICCRHLTVGSVRGLPWHPHGLNSAYAQAIHS